jgi:hypothetical protein
MGMIGSKTACQIVLVSLLILLSGSWAQLVTTVAGQTIPASPQPQNCVRPEVNSANLSSAICASKVHYRFGEIVEIVLTLTNTGPDQLQLVALSGSVFIMDRLGAPKLRQVDLNSCLTPESCSLSPGQSMSDTLARWITYEPFSQATLSGPYTVHLAVLACPKDTPCLEAVDVTIRITVAVPQS